MKSKGDGGLNPDLLQQYAIVDKDADFQNVLPKVAGKLRSGDLISIKSEKKKIDKQINSSEKKRNKHDHSSSKRNKKRKT